MRRAALAAATAVLIAVPAAGQTTSPPGPWVVDVRAVTSAAPTDVAFYPPTLTSTVVPSRGFGGDFGGHVYLFALGPARVGLGGSVMMVRGTATGPATAEEGAAPVDGQRVTLSMRVIAPQISFNFGSRDGWSYLSAGLGVGRISTEVDGVTGGDRQSGQRRAVNFGGGARWFIKPRLAFCLDLRALQISAGEGMPRTSVFTVGAGLSIR